jgi:type IX secretion system PorP/SprF family membrane protein
MKKINIFLSLFIISWSAMAQQEQHFTQFMFNKLAYNPAFAGSSNAVSATVLHRSQWVGFDGAPNAQVISFNTPLLGGRVGAGGNIMRQSIGIDQRITMDAVYAYRIPVAKGNLGIGLQGSIRYRGINFSDPRLISTSPLSQDQAIEMGYQTKFLPNVGLGAYYNTERFYFGASIPRLIKNNLSFGENDLKAANREVVHAYFMGGIVFPISTNLKLQPQTLIKISPNAPIDGEANMSLIYLDKYTAGMTYRSGGSSKVGIGESIDFLLAIQANEKLMLGFSYDYSLSELKNYNGGSFEVALRYNFRKAEGEQFINPRFF